MIDNIGAVRPPASLSPKLSTPLSGWLAQELLPAPGRRPVRLDRLTLPVREGLRGKFPVFGPAVVTPAAGVVSWVALKQRLRVPRNPRREARVCSVAVQGMPEERRVEWFALLWICDVNRWNAVQLVPKNLPKLMDP